MGWCYRAIEGVGHAVWWVLVIVIESFVLFFFFFGEIVGFIGYKILETKFMRLFSRLG